MKRMMIAGLSAAALMLAASAAMAQDKKTIAFVVNGPSDFWKITEAGVDKAQAELPDVELQFGYPERADAAVQQRVVDDLVAAGVDAVAVSVVDPATVDRRDQHASPPRSRTSPSTRMLRSPTASPISARPTSSSARRPAN